MLFRGTLMAQVLVTFKVMPKEAGIDLARLESEIKHSIGPDRIAQEPIAFGLVALKVSKLIDDAEGQLEAIENKLRALADVGEVEVVEITRTI